MALGGFLVLLSNPEISNPPISSFIEALQAVRQLTRPWLVFYTSKTEEALTGVEAWELAMRWARQMVEAGLQPGDRAIILAPNSPHFIGAFFGAQLAGVVPVPVAWPFFPEPEAHQKKRLKPVFDVAKPKMVLTTEDYKDHSWPVPCVIEPHAEPLDESQIAEPGQAAFIQFTSGTTGPGKGAVISQRAATYNAWAIGQALGITEADIGVSWLPLFHDMGLVGALLTSVMYRYSLHISRPGDFLLRPARWVQRLSDLKATMGVGPNFAFDQAVKRTRSLEGIDLSSIRFLLNGSEPVHRSTIERFNAKFGAVGLKPSALRSVYGLAENTLAVSFGESDDPDLTWEDRSVTSVGRPLNGMRCRVVDEAGETLPEGEQGEIVLQSPSLMDGYDADPEETAQTLRDGWLHTGDLGVIQNGRLYITGRMKDLIFKGGEKIHPYEIERVVSQALDSPPGGAAAFSVNDEEAGTQRLVVAVEVRVTRREGAEKKIRGALVEELGVRPDEVLLLGTGRLPRTSSGKVRRHLCHTLLKERS